MSQLLSLSRRGVSAEKAAVDPSHGGFDSTRPLGLYVHVPFCSVHCPYCDFAVDDRADIPHDRYADAVVAEILARAPWFGGQLDLRPALRSIYFGGGTPGLLQPAALGRIIAAALSAFPATELQQIEVTLEANPGEVTAALAESWRALGISRISLGLQAFQDHLLTALGRNHDSAAIPQAFSLLRAAGFSNITCDLMFGLPGQTDADWAQSLSALIALGPSHVSCYSLTIERGTRFGSLERAGKLSVPDDDVAASMFRSADDALLAAGFEHYEVSNYGRPGQRAIHNQLYWTGGAYLGVGCSAASFRPVQDGSGYRFTNPRATETYLTEAARLDGLPTPALVEHRAAADLENEALWLALRTSDGVDRRLHAHQHGADPLADPERAKAAEGFVRSGWLVLSPDRIRPTREGLLFADEIAAELWRTP